jgi:hypothetical protein
LSDSTLLMYDNRKGYGVEDRFRTFTLLQSGRTGFGVIPSVPIPDSVYVGRIVSARLINPSSQERSAKIDISIELVDDAGARLHDCF